MHIGFIGVGHMGKEIAGRLIRLGHELTVFNRTRSRALPLEREGAHLVATPYEAARGVDVVVTMLSDDEAVAATVLGFDGAISALGKNCVHLSMSTISPAMSKRLARAHAEAGQLYVAGPVLGRPEVAHSGALIIVAAGPAAGIDRCRPIFDALAKETHVIGALPEMANVIKLAANFFLATILEALGEAFALVESFGIEDQAFMQILNGALLKSQVIENYGKRIAEGSFEPAGFSLGLGAKDVRLAVEAGESGAVSMPLASVLRDRFVAAIAHGKKNADWAAVGRVSTEKT
jgi:3-hydroxyisobutyrate dehydrogenase-like beta-hydroxyacid dehydrogenase